VRSATLVVQEGTRDISSTMTLRRMVVVEVAEGHRGQAMMRARGGTCECKPEATPPPLLLPTKKMETTT
jgi:hypothetical protein